MTLVQVTQVRKQKRRIKSPNTPSLDLQRLTRQRVFAAPHFQLGYPQVSTKSSLMLFVILHLLVRSQCPDSDRLARMPG